MRIQLWIVLGPCMVLTQTQSAEVITLEIIDEFLKGHNRERVKFNERALTWDQTLSNYAAQCLEGSNCQFQLNTGPYGENVYGTLANYNNVAIAEMALNMWNKEAADVDLPDWNCISQGQCRRYSQVAWRDTRTVGCAIIHCLPTETLRYLAACEYYPPCNVNGETPY